MTDRIVHLGYDKDGKAAGYGFSGRLVRLTRLKSATLHAIEKDVAKNATRETTVIEFNAQIARAAVESMIVAVSEPVASDKRHEAKLRPVNAEQVKSQFDTLFTPKDQALLMQRYEREYNVSPTELDAILGGEIGAVD